MQLSFASGLFWVSVACCAIAQWFIIRSVWRSRGPHPERDKETLRYAQSDSPHPPRSGDGMEVLWAVLPAVGLAVLLAYTWRAVMR